MKNKVSTHSFNSKACHMARGLLTPRPEGRFQWVINIITPAVFKKILP
jgi:hypothetical protein